MKGPMEFVTDRAEAIRLNKLLQIKEEMSSYDLIDRVIELIWEEPRRMRMNQWGSICAGDNMGDNQPPCGTIGCVAGWSGLLITGLMGALSGAETAYILGGPELHSQLYNDVFLDSDLTNDKGQGSIKHAARVVVRLAQFQREHEHRLKEIKVRPIEEKEIGTIRVPDPSEVEYDGRDDE